MRAHGRAQMLFPTSRRPASATAPTASKVLKPDDRQKGQGMRRGERLELLDPAQRGDPDQPMEAHSGVGDEAEGIAHPEEGSAKGGGLAAGGRQLAGDGPDDQEHDRRCHHGQGEVQRGSPH